METINEEVEEVKNEEVNEVVNNETIEATPKEEQKQEEEVKNEEVEEQAKPKAKPKKQARSVKVVELVTCPDCDKKMLPKSLRHSHPRNCKGQPTETRPVNKQQNSYGTKLKEQMRKEIEEEMNAKYSVKEKQRQQEQIQQSSKPVDDVKTSSRAGDVITSPPVKIEEAPQRIPTARELLEASYEGISNVSEH